VAERQRLHDWERAAARHAVLQQRIGGAELATPVEKAVGRHGGERGVMKRKANESTRWRGRCSEEKVSRRHSRDGRRDAQRSAVACLRRCGEFFFLFSFFFLENYGC
jgi:hypothetical protein